ncbi:hypothetical protein AB1K56_07940 [Microbacterium sp. BWR-S6Y]
MADPNDYLDPTLVDTLRESGAPRILTTRKDLETVYVALDDSGQLIEVSL